MSRPPVTLARRGPWKDPSEVHKQPPAAPQRGGISHPILESLTLIIHDTVGDWNKLF